MVDVGRYINIYLFFCRGFLASSFLEALLSGARPMEIVASTALMSVSNVFVLFHYLLWKAKLDLTALSKDLDSWSINVSFSTGSIASCGVMKTPSCSIHFRPKEVHYLGHVLSPNGIRIGEDQIKAIVGMKTPTTIKELRSVLGSINFVRKFVPNLARIINPLVTLTRKTVVKIKSWRNHWGPEQNAAFIKVKEELLTSAPVLYFPRFHESSIIHVDASDCGASAFLAQKENNGKLAIIAYFSKRFTSSQQHYSAAQKECLAVVLAVTHWRPYTWGRHFVCVTDPSALRYLYSMQDTSNMLTRWAIALQSYDFTVEHKPGKLNITPDTLSRLFNFEHSNVRVAPHLAPICRNVPNNPAVHGPPRVRPYQVNSQNLDEI